MIAHTSLGRLAARALAAAALALGAGCASDQGFTDGVGDNSAAPDIVVTPDQLVWDLVPFGTSEVRQVTVRNDGNARLDIDGVTLGDVGAFSIVADTFPIPVDPGSTYVLDVVYTPTTTEDSSRLYVESNDPDSPEVSVELLATAGSPRLQITPPTHDFESLPVFCRDSVELTLENVGTARLEVTDLTQVGESFALTDPPEVPFELAPGETETVFVTFQPVIGGEFAGELYVESNDPAGFARAAQSGLGFDDGFCVTVEEGEEVQVDLSFPVEYRIADIAFLLDTTGSMSGLAQAMAGEFGDIAGALAGFIPDITFGVATYEDYNYSSMGSGVDKPFVLRQQQTDDFGLVQASLNSVQVHSGDDEPESTIEALYQAASGMGYDQDCDGSYDSQDDVYPFIASAADPFAGAAGDVYDPTVPGTGELGGYGFREDVLPIFIFATDARLRDAADSAYRTPGGCHRDAAMSDAIGAISALNGRVVGIGVQMSDSATPMGQMRAIAAGTGSFGDMDGDGLSEEAVIRWNGTSSEFRNSVVRAVEGLVGEGTFDEVRLEVVGDDYGMIRSISPDAHYDVESGEEVDFDIDLRGEVASGPSDQTVTIELLLIGTLQSGDEVTLDRIELYVLIPGT